ncbi:hypothetical protein ACZ91_49725 [Streptomyces regensis]|nr:hypothetical protein ACZ91_49725 [Streptomyces regensis]
MPTIDMTIIIGIIIMKGLGACPSCSRGTMIMPTMPSIATIMTTGRIFIMMLPGMARGTSGGGSRWTSPPGGRGAARRGDRLNCSVLTEKTPLQVGYSSRHATGDMLAELTR